LFSVRCREIANVPRLKKGEEKRDTTSKKTQRIERQSFLSSKESVATERREEKAKNFKRRLPEDFAENARGIRPGP